MRPSPRHPALLPAAAASAGVAAVVVVASRSASALHPLLPDNMAADSAPWLGSAAMALAVGGWLFALHAAWHQRISVRLAVGISVAMGIVVLFVPLLLSRDLYNYALYGRMAAAGYNPYITVPDQVTSDPFSPLSGEKWRDIPSVYGPAFTALSAALTKTFRSIPATVWAFRTVATAAAIATVLVVAWLARRLAPQRAAAAVVLVGMNPVIVFQAVGGGHNDVLVGLCIAGGLALALQRRPVSATAIFTLGALVKASAGLALVLFLVWAIASRPTLPGRLRTAAACGLTAAVLTFAFAAWFWTPENPTMGLTEVATHRGGFSFITFLVSIGTSASGSVVRVLAVVAVVAVVVVLARHVARFGEDAAELGAAMAIGLLLLMLLSPFILTWYLAWVVPLAFLLTRVPRTIVIALSGMFAVVQTVAEPMRSPGAYDTMYLVIDWVARPVVSVLTVWLLVDLVRRLRGGASLADRQRDPHAAHTADDRQA